MLDDLRTKASQLSDSEFSDFVQEDFVTILSDGRQVDLCPGGKQLQVTKENLSKYIQLVVETRLNESKKQMDAILEGVNFVIPINICRLLNWKQIEKRATGSKSLDITEFKKATRYEGCYESDEHIQFFWRAMHSFNDEERSLYLKFVWGRSRLPAKTDQFHKITSLTYNERANLPISHTCYFTLDLPRYPNYEVCREKILFAIRFCGDIDADRSSSNIVDED